MAEGQRLGLLLRQDSFRGEGLLQRQDWTKNVEDSDDESDADGDSDSETEETTTGTRLASPSSFPSSPLLATGALMMMLPSFPASPRAAPKDVMMQEIIRATPPGRPPASEEIPLPTFVFVELHLEHRPPRRCLPVRRSNGAIRVAPAPSSGEASPPFPHGSGAAEDDCSNVATRRGSGLTIMEEYLRRRSPVDVYNVVADSAAVDSFAGAVEGSCDAHDHVAVPSGAGGPADSDSDDDGAVRAIVSSVVRLGAGSRGPRALSPAALKRLDLRLHHNHDARAQLGPSARADARAATPPPGLSAAPVAPFPGPASSFAKATPPSYAMSHAMGHAARTGVSSLRSTDGPTAAGDAAAKTSPEHLVGRKVVVQGLGLALVVAFTRARNSSVTSLSGGGDSMHTVEILAAAPTEPPPSAATAAAPGEGFLPPPSWASAVAPRRMQVLLRRRKRGAWNNGLNFIFADVAEAAAAAGAGAGLLSSFIGDARPKQKGAAAGEGAAGAATDEGDDDEGVGQGLGDGEGFGGHITENPMMRRGVMAPQSMADRPQVAVAPAPRGRASTTTAGPSKSSSKSPVRGMLTRAAEALSEAVGLHHASQHASEGEELRGDARATPPPLSSTFPPSSTWQSPFAVAKAGPLWLDKTPLGQAMAFSSTPSVKRHFTLILPDPAAVRRAAAYRKAAGPSSTNHATAAANAAAAHAAAAHAAAHAALSDHLVPDRPAPPLSAFALDAACHPRLVYSKARDKMPKVDANHCVVLHGDSGLILPDPDDSRRFRVGRFSLRAETDEEAASWCEALHDAVQLDMLDSGSSGSAGVDAMFAGYYGANAHAHANSLHHGGLGTSSSSSSLSSWSSSSLTGGGYSSGGRTTLPTALPTRIAPKRSFSVVPAGSEAHAAVAAAARAAAAAHALAEAYDDWAQLGAAEPGTANEAPVSGEEAASRAARRASERANAVLATVYL